MLLCGASGIGWVWFTALDAHHVLVKAAFLGPAAATLGLGLLLFPGYRTERLARGESIDALDGLALLTTRWRIILALCLLLGAANAVALAYFLERL